MSYIIDVSIDGFVISLIFRLRKLPTRKSTYVNLPLLFQLVIYMVVYMEVFSDDINETI